MRAVSWSLVLLALALPARGQPEALLGTYEDARGGDPLVVARHGAPGLLALRQDERRGQARLLPASAPDGAEPRPARLEVRWAGRARGMTGAVGAEEPATTLGPAAEWPVVWRDARLGLESPGGTRWRTPTSRWGRLTAAERDALVGPLQSLPPQPGHTEPFDAWRARVYGELPVPEREARAERGYDGLSHGQRVALGCLVAKMTRDAVWRFVRAIRYVGQDGVLLFEPSLEPAALQRALAARGFGPWWAAGRGRPWGVRSRLRGLQLHFRGGSPVNVHLDLENPGDPQSGEVTGAFGKLRLAWRHG